METAYNTSIREIESAKYKEVLRLFEEKQQDNKRALRGRTDEIYEKIPRIKEIDLEISAISLERAAAAIKSDLGDLSDYKEKISSLNTEKIALLKKHGFGENYLSLSFSCDKCMDTGFIDGKLCSCFKQELYNRLYNQSNIPIALSKENFSNFNFDYYSDEPMDMFEYTPLQNIKLVVNKCNEFIRNFGHSDENLFIYGETGVGKTFLTNCIAKELISKSYSVVYISAVNLFEMLADTKSFSKDYDTQMKNLSKKHLFDADLLIIDDLGAELTNAYTSSHLFNCLNERMLTQKSTIISTNLSLAELQNRYSDRIFSRIVSNYRLIRIYGEDIRIMKKKMED